MTDYSLLSSPFSSLNVAALLQIKILSWSQETGFPVCIRVRVADTTFNLHKEPLICKSGYFREKLRDSNEVEVELPLDFPGGPKSFETIALFIYGSSTLVDSSNVASLRCAAGFLLMSDDLCQRFDVHLNQVVLQSWDHTLAVLRSCSGLLPWAEDLLIVSRCIETLAFMACMEILDPERRRDRPVVTLDTWAHTSGDLWVEDLIGLPLAYFERVVGSLRRQGMKEKYVGPIVLFYADKWVNGDVVSSSAAMMRGVIDLLPSSAGAGFYFSLLSRAVEVLGLGSDGVAKLRNRIVPVLHLSRVRDFLIPKDDGCLSVMESIFSTYYLDYTSTTTDTTTDQIRGNYSVVAELWDLYLNRIIDDNSNSSELIMSCKRFVNLIETVPISCRQTHDHLYRAINTFFQSRPNLSQEEKGLICRYLKCEKLSQEACIEAVQNEMMPIRLIIQALFVQQLNTQQAFKECSDSFRYTGGGEYSGSFSSSRYTNGSDQGGVSRPLSVLMQKDSLVGRQNDDMESTSFRMESLEKELVSLKKRLELRQRVSKKNIMNDKKIEPSGERMISKKKYGSCIGNVNFANRIMKLMERISLFGSGRSKRGSNV